MISTLATTRVAVVVTSLLLANAPGSAHHTTAADFDISKLTVLQGIAKQVEWINPHAWLRLDVERIRWRDNSPANRRGSPEALALRKFPKESVTAGIEISITVCPGRSGEHLADGDPAV